MTWSKEYWYEGEWHEDCHQGFGKKVYPEKINQIGFWKNDKLSGIGKEIRNDDQTFEGQYLDGQKHGFGRL